MQNHKERFREGRPKAVSHPTNHGIEPPRSWIAEILVSYHVDNVTIY